MSLAISVLDPGQPSLLKGCEVGSGQLESLNNDGLFLPEVIISRPNAAASESPGESRLSIPLLVRFQAHVWNQKNIECPWG